MRFSIFQESFGGQFVLGLILHHISLRNASRTSQSNAFNIIVQVFAQFALLLEQSLDSYLLHAQRAQLSIQALRFKLLFIGIDSIC